MARTMAKMHRRGNPIPLLVPIVALLAGCEGSLIKEKEDLSVYDRSDRVRGEQVPLYRFDEYGRRIPNIRGLLVRE